MTSEHDHEWWEDFAGNRECVICLDAAADDGGPYWVTVNTDPPKPPYGTPERAAFDAKEGPR